MSLSGRSVSQYSHCTAEELPLDLLCIAPTQAPQCMSVGNQCPAWLLKVESNLSVLVLGNLPCETTVEKGHVRLTEWLCFPLFIRPFEAIYLLSCHCIDSLLLRTINIARAIHRVAQLIVKDKTGTSWKSCTLGGISPEGLCGCCNLKSSRGSCNSKALVWQTCAQTATSSPKKGFK